MLFTGKGGVGKTTIAAASAVRLADAGQRILLVSTDPASNLADVLGAPAGRVHPVPVAAVPGLDVLDLDPQAACCAPLLRAPITVSQAADLARLLKALADPTRLRLVSMVAAREGGEACVCDLTEPLGLTQPTISHHLKILVEAGIFTRDKHGVWAYYGLVPEALNALSAVLRTS